MIARVTWTIKCRLCSRLLCVLACLLPAFVHAQAGSWAPITVDSSQAFYNDQPVSGAFQSGAQQPAMIPRGVLKLPREENYLLWVELDKGRLNLLQQLPNGGLTTRKIYPVSIGKNGFGKKREGDQRTPVGVYHFTSFLADRDLVDYYGLGAYPLNYPNVTDRLEHRTGFGIWLHGLPKDMAERPLLDSDGCVVIDNDSLLEMAAYINTGITHIVLSADEIQWQPVASVEERSASLQLSFEQWRQAWEARDNDTYLSFYAKDFSDFNRDRAQWASYKKRVNDSKKSIKVDVSKLSFFADPENTDLVTVRYYQQYRSNNYNWDGWKEQLWRQSDSGWQIVYEGNG